MTHPGPRLAYVNLFARNIDTLSGFYTALFGFAELAGHRSPIYRCLDAGGIELGFNAEQAYELLGLKDRQPTSRAPVRSYFTIEVAGSEAVDSAVARIGALGGRVIKAPYDTYYNARQAVLEDPEGNVFRVNFRRGQRLPYDQVPNPPWGHSGSGL